MSQEEQRPSSRDVLMSLVVAFSVLVITVLIVLPPSYSDYNDLVFNFLYMAPGPLLASLVLAKVYKTKAVNRGLLIGFITYLLSPLVLPSGDVVWALEAARMAGAGVGGAVGARIMELYSVKGSAEPKGG